MLAGADNEVKVICTAENGTEKVYTVIAKRAASHDGSAEPTEPPADPSEPPTEPTEPETKPSETPSTEPGTAPTDPDLPATTEQQKMDAPQNGNSIQLWLVMVVGIVCLAVGAVVGVLSQKVSKKK